MKSMKLKLVLLILIAGMVSACGGQATEAPASAPTETAVPAISSPSETAIVPTDTAQAQPTEAPMTDPGTQSTGGTVSYANDIAPLLQSRCGSCHGGNQTQADLNLLSYAALMSGSENGPVIIPGDATKSLLVDLVASQKMPKRGPKLTPDQVQLITDWVNQGASDN